MQLARRRIGKCLKAGFVLLLGVAGQGSPATAQSPWRAHAALSANTGVLVLLCWACYTRRRMPASAVSLPVAATLTHRLL